MGYTVSVEYRRERNYISLAMPFSSGLLDKLADMEMVLVDRALHESMTKLRVS